MPPVAARWDAACDRAFQRLDPVRCSKAREAHDLVAAVGRHLDPGAACGQPLEQSAGTSQNRLADLGRGQAGDGVAGAGGRIGGTARGGGAEPHEPLDGGGGAVEDRDRKTVADQARGKVAAEVAKADEGVAFAHGINGVCIICRCNSLPV